MFSSLKRKYVICIETVYCKDKEKMVHFVTVCSNNQCQYLKQLRHWKLSTARSEHMLLYSGHQFRNSYKSSRSEFSTHIFFNQL